MLVFPTICFPPLSQTCICLFLSLGCNPSQGTTERDAGVIYGMCIFNIYKIKGQMSAVKNESL